MHEAQGETMQPGPSSRGAREGTAGSRQAPPPGRIPARSPGTGQARPAGAELLRPTGGWNFPPDGVVFMRVSPRCLNEGRWAAASGSSCNLPPSSPRPETVFLLFIFFLRTRCCCLPPQPLPAAKRHPLAAACTSASGGRWQPPQHSSRHRQQLTLNSKTDDPEKRETPCDLGTGLKKSAAKAL